MRRWWILMLVTCASTVKLSADPDTNFLHLGLDYGWAPNSKQELPHRIRWHDGYFGPELVRMELVTNTVSRKSTLHADKLLVITNRVLVVVAPGVTNNVQLATLGVGYEAEAVKPAPAPACSCQCCSGAKDIPIQVINGGFTNVIYSTNYYFFDPSTALITP